MDEILEDYTFTNPNLWSTKIRQHNDFCYEIPNLEIFYNVWDWLYEHEISEKYYKIETIKRYDIPMTSVLIEFSRTHFVEASKYSIMFKMYFM